MIKIFRNLRKQLLSEGKTSKYLKYAIGEIVLVVIGILIALSINNWNEFKKERKQERKVLSELLSSMENNYESMITDSLLRIRWNTSSDIVIKSLEKGMPYIDTMNYHYQNARIPGTNLSLSYAGYESLKNVGYDIISSDSLRKTIVDLFELKHKRLLEQMEYFESFQSDRQIKIDQHFSYESDKFNPDDPFLIPIRPNNYDVLQKDGTYLPMIKSTTMHRKMISTLVYDNMEATRKVIGMLKDELNKNTDD
ncbi:DUF6090 family protein [Seonamhaeicola maritimus]|uniref:DUF6090 family protein n=1 Tax=Seonamhaeicola maritimus TaxID=2591822 RepID=UPI002494EABB|nr:DUF6090 family protein [Seonamhaeicola maritimus]